MEVIKKLLFFLFLLITYNNIQSQSKEIRETEIKNCFKQLDKIESDIPDDSYHRLIYKSHPYYLSSFYEKMLDSVLAYRHYPCAVGVYSKRLALLEKIHSLCIGEESNQKFILVNQNSERIYDLLINKCGGRARKDYTISKQNEEAIEVLSKSYQEWYLMAQNEGIYNVLEKGILPSDFSQYKWLIDIFNLNGEIETDVLINYFVQILNDKDYYSYFVKDLKFYIDYYGITEKTLVNNRIVLSILNNAPNREDLRSFTYDIRNFKLEGEEEKINLIVKNLTIHQDYEELIKQLKEHNIKVVFRLQ